MLNVLGHLRKTNKNKNCVDLYLTHITVASIKKTCDKCYWAYGDRGLLFTAGVN